MNLESEKEKRINDLVKDLLECQEWIEKTGWLKLPIGVRKILVMGEIWCEDKIKAMKNDYM